MVITITMELKSKRRFEWHEIVEMLDDIGKQMIHRHESKSGHVYMKSGDDLGVWVLTQKPEPEDKPKRRR